MSHLAEDSFATEIAETITQIDGTEPSFEESSIADQAASAEVFFEDEVVVQEANRDFPQEEILVPEDVMSQSEEQATTELIQTDEADLVEGQAFPTEADAYHAADEEHQAETRLSDEATESSLPSGHQEVTDSTIEPRSVETVDHVPSSLERAMEILRDKEKRAAAVEEAEARKAEEDRLAAERAAQEAQQVAREEVQETTEEKYERSLKKTRTGFGAKLNAFFANFRTVDEEFFEDLEELLITSDVGVQVATTLTEELRQEAKLENAKKPEDLRRVIIEKLVDIYEQDGDFEAEKIRLQDGLTVMLFVGVNGVGKTTSIGKLANKYKKEGKKVMLVAADTFRAGAVAQLVEWARRVDVAVVTGPEKSDPASVVYDGMERAVAEGIDILMIDTAGRLQNKDNLMAELEKIGRIIKRVLPEAPHETLLALDASTGQNALVQAKEFSKITPLTGLVLTKIDGTARGGVVLAIRQELDIPVKLIGFGEKIDDIGQFDSEDFMRGLLDGLV
ncbi:signal recognition particle-docking protein FtsY [Streptococcus moroccensis]|uniref:signal recognition particle-docking protein FtsY n=1 Tax=Streptococcus moroccensis TaxID=1451356 RepID=UPI003F9C2E3B